MARTRGSKPKPKADPEAVEEEVKAKALSPPDSNPARVFILPKNTSSEARIITLNDPAKGQPSRYLLCPEKGLYEFTRVAAGKIDPRSWLFTQSAQQSKEDESTEEQTLSTTAKTTEGYLARSQDLFIATPVDPIFLLVPIFSGNEVFRTLEDYLDDAGEKIAPKGATLDTITNCISTSDVFTSRISAICDVLDTGMDKVYQFSLEKLSQQIYQKAIRIKDKGLPPSMQNHFVSRPLEPPIMAIKSNLAATTVVTTISQSTAESTETSQTRAQDNSDDDATQVASETTTTLDSQISMTSTVVDTASNSGSTFDQEVLDLSQLRTSINFILRSYVPFKLHESILQHICSKFDIDFGPLDKQLAKIEGLREDAQALRSISDNVSRKRGFEEDEDEVERRAEKKRKQEEEERRKKSENRAIKDLKKVDVKGMMKLSSFFSKKPPAKGKENTKA
jgi:Ydr279p protein family (RNase H2 complex component) wHTH domain/Ydr279p protein triple barrel domain